MDKDKVRAIAEWEEPTKVAELRSFLSLVNCVRRLSSKKDIPGRRSTYRSVEEES